MRYYLTCFMLVFLFILPISNAVGQKKIHRASVDADGIQRVEIVAGSYFFDPDHIVVKVNVPLELRIRREAGMVPHNFLLKEPDAGFDVNESLSTEGKVIRITPNKTGNYPFYCDKKLLFFESHRKKGMEGVIEVIE